MDKKRKQAKCIFWKKEATYTKVHNDEFFLILEKLQKEGKRFMDKDSFFRRDYAGNVFSLSRKGAKGDWLQIKYYELGFGYRVIATNWSFELLWKIIKIYPQLFLLY